MLNPQHSDPYFSLRRCKQRRSQMYKQFSNHYMPYCHTTLQHDFQETGKSFMVKNNSVKLNTTKQRISTISKNKNQRTLEKLLVQAEPRKTKEFVRSISGQIENTHKSQELTKSMMKLRELRLLGSKELPIAKYPGVRQVHIYNDYHTRGTNPGYSRNKTGGIFTS